MPTNNKSDKIDARFRADLNAPEVEIDSEPNAVRPPGRAGSYGASLRARAAANDPARTLLNPDPATSVRADVVLCGCECDCLMEWAEEAGMTLDELIRHVLVAEMGSR